MLLPIYLMNLFFGILIMLPFAKALDDFVWKSMMREKLGEAMNYDFLFEFLHYGSSGLASVQGMIMTVPFIYWVVALFLSGGAFVSLAKGEKYTPAAFWGGAAGYFGRILRLAMMAIPVVALLFCIRYLESLVEWIFFGSDPYEYIVYYGAWIKMGLGFVGFILFGLVFDYARIHLVLTDNHKVRSSLWHGFRFAATNFGKTFFLSFVLFITGWVMVFIYCIISPLFSGPSWAMVILLVIWQQLYIIFRMMLRLTAYSSQMEMFRKVAV
jgi:hypothetical protein